MAERQGALPYQLIDQMIDAQYILGATKAHLQPASLDLTITEEVYRMRGSYLPRQGESIADIIKRGTLFTHDLSRPLEQNGIYLIKLAESLRLPPGIRATASNKSSSGRINLRGRLLTDGVPRFDDVPGGHAGSLWIEIIPKSFPVLLHPGLRINQMRFFHGEARLSTLEHRMLYDRHGLLRDSNGVRMGATTENVGKGITMTVDLTSADIIGWQAKLTASSVLNTAAYDHDPADFFEPVFKQKSGEMVIRPGAFFILATKERIIVPPEFSSEMAAYDASKGEFRSHFAGFFDPGWGWTQEEEKRGTIAVLEVEAYSHDFVLRDGQPICLMIYERLLASPQKIYGADLSSHYSAQVGPRLAKWFRM